MTTPSSFKLFIAEAEEHETNVSRVISAIEKRMPSLLNTKIYRYGGKDGVEQTKGGKGYLYFFGENKAFRVRVNNSTIVAFDVWKKYTLDGPADYTIHTDTLSVAAIASQLKEIAKLIKAPKEGRYPVDAVKEAVEAISFEDAEDLFEAKTVSAEKFLELAKDELDNVESVTFDQIVAVAKKNNVGVPNKKWLDGQKVGRGRWTLVQGGGDSDSDSKKEKSDDKPDAKQDPILYIKVTAQDPVTKKFLSSSDNKQAQALYKQVQKAMDGPPTKEELRDTDTLFGELYELSELACRDKLKALLVYGGPGTGKSHTIEQAIKDTGLVKGKDYVKISGKITATELYKTLFMFRDGGLVLFDDCDSMWKDKDSSNFLKAALDTKKIREISSPTGNTMNVSKWDEARRDAYNEKVDRWLAGKSVKVDDDGEEDETDGNTAAEPDENNKMKFPSTFEFKGRVIFISNLKKEEFDTAILSRSAKIDMTLTPSEILARMRNILPTLGGEDISLKQKEELINVLLDLHESKIIDQVTMREFIKGADIIRSGSPNWKNLIKYA